MYDDTLFSTLRQVGFTGQEASLYVTLCLHGALTGYEAAKLSGISRSNAYAGLGSLVEKGGAVIAQGKPPKYVPVSPEELVTRLEHKYAGIFTFLRENLPCRLLPQQPYLTLSGTANIEAKVRDMLRNARLRVYLSLTAPILLIFEKELAACVARGLRVVLLSDEPPAVWGVEWYVGELIQGQIKLIVDTRELIFGSFTPAGQSSCLYSVNEQLVQLVREALINEIKLMRPGLSGRQEQEHSMPNVRSTYSDSVNFYGTQTPMELLQKFGSPLYVYNENILRQRCKEVRNLCTHPGFAVNYSTKANANPALLRIIREEGLVVDAMSPGELHIVREWAGFTPEQILYVCNNVSADELRNAVSQGVLVSVDSLSQLELLGRVAPGSSAVVRFNPGIGAGHHKKVVTGGKESKFGINLEDIPELRRILEKYDMTLAGVNQHIGSLFMRPDEYLAAVDVVFHVVEQEFMGLNAGPRSQIRIIDFGGGFGIPYRKYAGEARLDLRELGEKLDEKLWKFSNKTGYSGRFLIEPGRYVAAECGAVLSWVNSIKNNGPKRFVGTDIGFNVLARPMLYDSFHDIEIFRENGAPDKNLIPQTIVGNICESGDILARDRELPELQENDVLAMLDAGAYGFVMASTYNQRLRPAEVLIRGDGSASLIRRREILEDLTACFTKELV